MMDLAALIRYLQGERPGMSAGRDTEATWLSILAPSIAIANQVRIADVSFWQGEIDFGVMRSAGIAGAIIRAGQRTWVDSRFAENWGRAKAAGMPRGSYWFYDSREDPKRQALLWWQQIQNDPGELVHVADFEESYGGAFGSRAHFKEFVLEFQRLSGLPNDRIAIYTGFYFWIDRVGNDLFFARYKLWIAWYSAMGFVRVPEPWKESDLLFWQYTSSGNGTAYGVSSLEIDLNWYCCDAENFKTRFRVGIITPTPGGSMQIIKGTAKGSVTRRKAPAGDAFSPARYLLLGDEIEADRQDVTRPQWLHLTKINGVAVVGDEWASAGASQQYIGWQWVTVVDEPPPPPPPEPVPTGTPFTLKVDGFKLFTGEMEKE